MPTLGRQLGERLKTDSDPSRPRCSGACARGSSIRRTAAAATASRYHARCCGGCYGIIYRGSSASQDHPRNAATETAKAEAGATAACGHVSLD